MVKQNILVILGTNRTARNGRKVADWFMGFAQSDNRFNLELVDLAELNLPWLDEPLPSKLSTDYAYDHTRAWSKKIAQADGYILVTSEYNHSYPAVLKNAIDYLYYEWGQKPVGFIGYGVEYGHRAIEHLRQIAVKLHMAPMSHQVEIHIFKQMDEDGTFTASESNIRQAKTILDQLAWWTSALSSARQKKPYSIKPL
jgi:NAD(P)H-dependent FMN reductase